MTDPIAPLRSGDGPRVSRRALLAGAAAVGGAAVVGALGVDQLTRAGAVPIQPGSPPPSPPAPGAPPAAPGAPAPSPATVPFLGSRQAGIVTPAQDRLAFAAFDVTTTDRGALATMLRQWTAAAALMTAGQAVGPMETHPLEPPVDTGEALGLPASRLTITVGFGPSLFDDRFGLAGRMPQALAPLPALPGDALRLEFSGGDLAVQACADDPQVAFHAVRNLARLGRGVVATRWFQLGFGRTSSTSASQETPRNLMGFKDGTNNIVAEDGPGLDGFVWVGDETDQPWLRGGTYLVARRIRMLIETWDRTGLGEQERVIGRTKVPGAPLGGTAEHDPVDLARTGSDGQPVIAADAHIRLAAPVSNNGMRILRRGYSFTDGIDPVTGELDAGLFFIAFMKDPHRQFVPIQRALGLSDALTEYIKHVGSAVFACPPGLAAGGSWADPLFA